MLLLGKITAVLRELKRFEDGHGRMEEERKIRVRKKKERVVFKIKKIDDYVFLITSICKNTFLVLVPLIKPIDISCHISKCHVGVR